MEGGKTKNSSVPSDAANSGGSCTRDIRESDLIGEAAKHQERDEPAEDACDGGGEEEPLPPVAGEEEKNGESEEIPIKEGNADGDADGENVKPKLAKTAEHHEASEDVGAVDSEEEPLPPVAREEEKNVESEENPIEEGNSDVDGDGDAEAAEHQARNEATEDVYTITELVKPIGYSASLFHDRQEDVSVTFLAKRSDGKETLVDNEFLKMNNPHLLIDFYEQILRFNPSA